MTQENLLNRITINPEIMSGKPVIKGTRLTVDYILNILAYGSTVKEIVAEYEGLTSEDIQACLLFASKTLESSQFMPLLTLTPSNQRL